MKKILILILTVFGILFYACTNILQIKEIPLQTQVFLTEDNSKLLFVCSGISESSREDFPDNFELDINNKKIILSKNDLLLTRIPISSDSLQFTLTAWISTDNPIVEGQKIKIKTLTQNQLLTSALVQEFSGSIMFVPDVVKKSDGVVFDIYTFRLKHIENDNVPNSEMMILSLIGKDNEEFYSSSTAHNRMNMEVITAVEPVKIGEKYKTSFFCNKNDMSFEGKLIAEILIPSTATHHYNFGFFYEK